MTGLGSIVLVWIFLAACGGTPYLEASLNPAEFEKKPQSWFEERWGIPSGKSTRFFGGETWTYWSISGGKSTLNFFNATPTKCPITLDFDKEGNLENYSYSGC